jgi:[pyruvate, water dikinase]-phosphate phosphotransferase / [pyruvate, water dikinase] kinase
LPTAHFLHLMSDSTGETASAAANAVLSQFGDPDVERRMHVFVRGASDVTAALEDIRAHPGTVVYTILDETLATQVREGCQRMGVPAVPLLDPLFETLSRVLGPARSRRPGKQYETDRLYFERVAAIEYAMAHDDGAVGDRLRRADVILLGVSRTSKTPTCLYLAVRGVKAANVPLVPNRPLPPELEAVLEAGVTAIGLTASPSRLAQIRGQRLESIGGEGRAVDYADIDHVREEVAQSRLLFERLGIPVIDVTRRSIEETAASIMAELRARREAP